MGSLTRETVPYRVIGKHRSRGHHVVWGGVPAEGRIEFVKAPFPCHKGLTASALLGRTSEVDYGPALLLSLKIVLKAHGPHQGADTEKVMAAAMTVSITLKRFLNRHTGLLAQARKGIIFPEKADNGLSASPSG